MRLWRCDRCGKDLDTLPPRQPWSVGPDVAQAAPENVVPVQIAESAHELCKACAADLRQWIKQPPPRRGRTEGVATP